MSDYRAIAGVTNSLRLLLMDRLQEASVAISCVPPDISPDNVQGRRLNLYLYQVNENGFLKNQEIHGQGHPGAYGHPPLSLELHYLLTAYPANETAVTSDIESQRILGDAMTVLHDAAILNGAILDASLQNAFEDLKITLAPMSLDDFTKIWTALPESSFRRSVAYKASVIQMESRRPRRIAAPVEVRRVHVAISRRPEISSVYRTPLSSPPEPAGDPRAAVLDSLTVEGSNFLPSGTLIRLGEMDPFAVQPAGPDLIEFQIPDDPSLLAGPQLVQAFTLHPADVVQGGLEPGESGVDQRRQASNQAVFMLAPQIFSATPPAASSDGVLTITGSRLFDPSLKSYVVIGDAAIEVADPGPNGFAQSDTMVRVSLTALETAMAGAYPVRVISNGAMSIGQDRLFELIEVSP